MLLWEEYCAQDGDEQSTDNPVKPWRYSQFCENYSQFAKPIKRSMRQVHRAGEKLFIDSADPTIALINGSQEVGRAYIFVAAMGVSGYCFCLATPAQTAKDWLGATAQALTFYCGVTLLVDREVHGRQDSSTRSKTRTYFCLTTGVWLPWTVKPGPACWRSFMTGPANGPP